MKFKTHFVLCYKAFNHFGVKYGKKKIDIYFSFNLFFECKHRNVALLLSGVVIIVSLHSFSAHVENTVGTVCPGLTCVEGLRSA